MPYTGGLGCSCLPGSPGVQPGLSPHTQSCSRAPPGGTREPRVLPSRGLQDQPRVSLLPWVWVFPVFSQKEDLSQPSTSVRVSRGLPPPAHRSRGLPEPVCWGWTTDGLRRGQGQPHDGALPVAPSPQPRACGYEPPQRLLDERMGSDGRCGVKTDLDQGTRQLTSPQGSPHPYRGLEQTLLI